LSRQGLLHDHRESRPIHIDGLLEKEGGDDSLTDIKKAPRLLAGLFRILAIYFFFFVAFFFAGAFFLAGIFNSPPILNLSTTIARLLRASLLQTFLRHVAKNFKAKIDEGHSFLYESSRVVEDRS
jgi:hypothetical protein